MCSDVGNIKEINQAIPEPTVGFLWKYSVLLLFWMPIVREEENVDT